MMHVVWFNETWRIAFRYEERTTIATMRRELDGVVFHRAKVTCHPKVQFCYAIGRKLALTRLLSARDFNKQDRESIWRIYWSKTPKPRKHGRKHIQKAR